MTRVSDRRMLGVGWRFAIAPDATSGRLEYQSGAEQVRQSVGVILATEPGERIMRPDFGCGLRRYLMKPNTAATRALIQREVETALNAWEPRIQVQAVVVEASLHDPALIEISIDYQHRHDGSTANLVYPFYLE